MDSYRHIVLSHKMSEKDNFKLEKEKAVKNLQVFTWENFEDKNVLLPMFAADAADDVYKNINYPKSVPIVSVIPKKKQMKTNATEGSQAKKVAEPVKKTTKKPDEATKPDEADDDDPRVLALLKELASAREARPPPDVRPIKKRSNAKSTKPIEATETKKVFVRLASVWNSSMTLRPLSPCPGKFVVQWCLSSSNNFW